jgi:NAD(P)-dependent dehydrogenase (short-subunit alcohol dehydrogenase family)
MAGWIDGRDLLMRRLEGKTAVVCGCDGGIGGATVERLAQEGASLVLADLKADVVEAMAADLEARGVSAMAVQVDLAEEESVVALYAKVKERFATIDVLHNNASDTSIPQMGADLLIEDMETRTWDRAFHINTRGTMMMAKHVLPTMVEQGGGSIINTSSGAALLGDLFCPAYASSKAAVNVLTRYIATQYGKQNIRCNVVSPGLIVSATARRNVGHKFEMFEKQTLMPTLGDPEDIAAMVALLASDDGKFITGQIIPIDGGIAMHFPYFPDMRPVFDAAVEAKRAGTQRTSV